MNIRMSSEIRPNIRPSAVAINTTPLWLVEVMIVKGGDCPGSRVGVLEAMTKASRGSWRKRSEGQMISSKLHGASYRIPIHIEGEIVYHIKWS